MSAAIVIFDSVSAFAFALAAVASVVYLRKSDRLEWTAVAVLALAVALYSFVSISNILEHSSLTDAFDVYEDYVEILFFPLLAYVVYSVDAGDRMRRLRRAEESVRRERDLTATVIDTSPAAIMMVDDLERVVFMSDSARSLFRVAHGAEPEVGRLTVRPYARFGSAGPVMTIADVAAHAPIRDELFELEDGDAPRIVSASAERTGEGPGESVVIALFDVSERIRLDVELASYRADLEGQVEQRTAELSLVNEQLHRANQAKQDFLSKMSHELRTPLNSIIGFTGVILRGMAGEVTKEQRTQLQMVERAGQRLLSLVSDILDISKIETGQATVSMRPAQIHAVVASLVGELRPLAEERKVTLLYENESTRPEVRTDPDKVEQIMRNLISNGLKFTPEGGTVRVTVADTSRALIITVADTGRGMTATEKTMAFEPFYQAEGERGAQAPAAGTGLGLAIARELAELIGATITVTSEYGRGSTFTMLIPV